MKCAIRQMFDNFLTVFYNNELFHQYFFEIDCYVIQYMYNMDRLNSIFMN